MRAGPAALWMIYLMAHSSPTQFIAFSVCLEPNDIFHGYPFCILVVLRRALAALPVNFIYLQRSQF